MDDLNEQQKILLREKQGELVKVVEAFERLEKSKEWEVVKESIYDKSLQGIERQLLNEVLMPVIDINKLYKLQGEWAWAKQFTDIPRFLTSLRQQLEGIKKQL